MIDNVKSCTSRQRKDNVLGTRKVYVFCFP